MSIAKCCLDATQPSYLVSWSNKQKAKCVCIALLCLATIAVTSTVGFYLSGKNIQIAIFAGGGTLLLELGAFSIRLFYFNLQLNHRLRAQAATALLMQESIPQQKPPVVLPVVAPTPTPVPVVPTIVPQEVSAPLISQQDLIILRAAQIKLTQESLKFEYRPNIRINQLGVTLKESQELCRYIEANRARMTKEVLQAQISLTHKSKRHNIPRSVLFYFEEGSKENAEEPKVKIYILFNKFQDGYIRDGTNKTIKLAIDYDTPTIPLASYTIRDPMSPKSNIPPISKELIAFNLIKGMQEFIQLLASSEVYKSKATRPPKDHLPHPSSKMRFITKLCVPGDLHQQYDKMSLSEKMVAIQRFIINVVNVHRAGLLIRDIKCENVLREEDGTVRFCDITTVCREEDLESRTLFTGDRNGV